MSQNKTKAAFMTQGSDVRIVRISRKKTAFKLPPSDTQRWVMSRKVQVIAAVREGRISFVEACTRYRLSEEELRSWMSLLETHGPLGLRATRMQEYRPPETRQDESKSIAAEQA